MFALDVIVIAAAVIMLCLAVYSRLSTNCVFWPPPAGRSLQRILTLLLFRTMFYGLVFISINRAMNGEMQNNIWFFQIGALLCIAGIGTATLTTLLMGWANAFGGKQGLRVTGFFVLSRNPIYVFTWIGQFGWALLIPQPIIIFVLCVWGLLYLIAIPLEERWLKIQYGKDYLSYCEKTPRYI